MLTCGLKLTHDGAVALIDDNRLVFSIEMEKLNNNARYSSIDDLAAIEQIFDRFGYDLDDVDHFAVDGWGGTTPSPLHLKNGGEDTVVTLAPYHEDATVSVLQPGYEGTILLGGRDRPYSSYFHVTGHIASAYYASPFAALGQPAFVLVWDGGMFPRLYFVDPDQNRIENGGTLFPVMGHFYPTAGNHFGPWPRVTDPNAVAGHSIAGKLMAYIAKGKENPQIVKVLARLWDAHFTGLNVRAIQNRKTIGGWGLRSDVTYLGEFYLDLREQLGERYSDEDVLASMHAFVEVALVDATAARTKSWKGDLAANLCFTGGCALNIKWNSALRESGVFRDVWVPPFCNDSGTAIGAAISHVARLSTPSSKPLALDWTARQGPELLDETPPKTLDGWTREPCDVAGLASLLHAEQEPVIVLNGRAELGPRALGARSIIAAPTSPEMKNRLNDAKGREAYRPVAPLCLETEAQTIFSPGTPDPYMVFDHDVRPEYLDRIPAVVHLDGTARLQTVCDTDDPLIAALLREYAKLSGVPVLCNTSANHAGRGFFPDVSSAADWGRLNYIWTSGYLYRKKGVPAPR